MKIAESSKTFGIGMTCILIKVYSELKLVEMLSQFNRHVPFCVQLLQHAGILLTLLTLTSPSLPNVAFNIFPNFSQ